MALLLTVYCVLILAASLVGGLVPIYVKLTHRRMQVALSFVSGVMLGVAMLHLVPHAGRAFAEAGVAGGVDEVMLWLLVGFLIMFLVERFFSFHQHEEGTESDAATQRRSDGGDGGRVGAEAGGGHTGHASRPHGLSWTGATIGLAVHSILAGVALGASVEAGVHEGGSGLGLAGFGAFLVIFLHKPFDSLTIGTLMAAGARPVRLRQLVNALFALAVPLGAAAFVLGLRIVPAHAGEVVGGALAFSAGMFLCIALSDLLPELQFHQHDRLKLSAALLAGLVLAWSVGFLEDGAHHHGPEMQADETGHDHAE